MALLYSLAANATSAAVRLIPLGHDAAQEALHEAVSRIPCDIFRIPSGEA